MLQNSHLASTFHMYTLSSAQKMYAETGLEFRFMQDCSPDIQQFDNLFKSYKLSDETGCLCFGLSKLSLARQMIRQFCSADGKKRSKLYTGLVT